MSPRLVPAAVVLGLFACDGATPPPPRILSVAPAQRPASSAGPVTVTLDAVLPTAVDFGSGTATVDDTLAVQIGPRPFGPGHWADAGVVTDFLASTLPEGTYDVRVQLGDGRQATASGAFKVTAGDFPTGYTLSTIPTQTSGVPFAVTITAQGARDGGYGGTVNLGLTTPRGTLAPGISGAFDAGVRTEMVTVTTDREDEYQIRVQDLVGHFGISLPFHVRVPDAG